MGLKALPERPDQREHKARQGLLGPKALPDQRGRLVLPAYKGQQGPRGSLEYRALLALRGPLARRKVLPELLAPKA